VIDIHHGGSAVMPGKPEIGAGQRGKGAIALPLALSAPNL